MKKDFIWSCLAFVFTISIDVLLKNHHSYSDTAHFNRGFIFGTLQDLPANLTLVTLCSVGAVLFFIYLILILLLSKELISLKLGLGFLVGGVLGNVIDRAFHGGTLDFIPLSFLGNTYLYYNPADFCQWVGALLILFNIFKRDEIIWYPENQRSFNLINPQEQLRFALKLTLISLSTCLILGIFSLSYLTLTFKNSQLYSTSIIIGFVISYLAISVVFNLVVFVAGIILSNKSAGPLYAFEKYVENLLAGDRKDFKLREGDNYQHLIEVAHNLKDYFNQNHK
jgi:signal peptidase II